MRKVLLSLFGILLFSSVFSQDKIVMNSGEVLYGKVEEVGVTEVKYKKQDNLTGPLYALNKADVYAIHYENGTKDILAATPEKTTKKDDDYVKPDGKKKGGDNDDVYGGGDDQRKDGKKKRKHHDHDRVDIVVPIWQIIGWVFFFDFILGCF